MKKSKARKSSKLPKDPKFLKGRVSPAEVESAKTRKPSRETAATLNRAQWEAMRKVGWAETERERASTDAEWEYFDARYASAGATAAGIVDTYEDHVRREHASRIARKPRQLSWVSKALQSYLAANPNLTQRDAYLKLRGEASQVAEGCTDVYVQQLYVSWRDKLGRPQTASLKDCLNRARLRLKRQSRK
jgi:hypothetical protein